MNEWILINEIPSFDLSQISHLCCTLMRDLAEIQFRNLIIKIHLLTGFCLIRSLMFCQLRYWSTTVYYYLAIIHQGKRIIHILPVSQSFCHRAKPIYYKITLGVKIANSPGVSKIINKSVKVCKDTNNTSYIWGCYHTITNHTI